MKKDRPKLNGRRKIRAALEALHRCKDKPVAYVKGPKWVMAISVGATTMNPGHISRSQMGKISRREMLRRKRAQEASS